MEHHGRQPGESGNRGGAKASGSGAAEQRAGDEGYIDPLTGAVTGIILDTQKYLQSFWMEMNEIEGLVATYSQAAYNAANEDSFGSVLGPELSQWLWDVLPYNRFTLFGGSYTLCPPCSPVCRSISITNGLNYLIEVDWSIMGDIEGLAVQNGERAPNGTRVVAVDLSTGEDVASGETDSEGYAVITPVPANSSEGYTVSA
jgi:hypothetical protein